MCLFFVSSVFNLTVFVVILCVFVAPELLPASSCVDLQLVGVGSVSCSFPCGVFSFELLCSYLNAEMQKHDASFSAAPSSQLCCLFLTHKNTVNHYYVSILSPHDNFHLNNAFSSLSLEQRSTAAALLLFNGSAASLCSTLQNDSA